jgi:hypothetical protein
MSPEISVAPTTSQKRIDANRRNAQRSTGPRTPEGKSRSRFNGLKHGLTATVPVIPGEDAAAYQARVEAMIESCAPQNQVELELLERVAATTWSLDRATRAEAAQLSQRIRNHTIDWQRREEDEAAALGQRLLWDARGPWQLYPHHAHTGLKWESRTSWSNDPADPNNPALLVLRLERTVAGCQWLLDRWAELRARLEPGEAWAASDQFKSIRLLGKQPLDAVDDPEVILICLGSVKLLPDGDESNAFALVKRELHDGKREPETYTKELKKRALAKLRPRDADAARQALLALVDRHTSRLRLILARNSEFAEADAAEAPARLAFDPSPEGEKLRRYVLSAARLANQTIKTFLSVVRCPLSVVEEEKLEDAERGAVGPPEHVAASAHELPAQILRTEPNVDSSVVRCQSSVVAEDKQDERERGAGDIAVLSPESAAASAHERSAQYRRTEPNVDSSVVRCQLSVVAEEKQDEPERGAGDGAVQLPEDAAATAHERPAQNLRTEPNAVGGTTHPPRSIAAHAPRASALAGAPTTGVAVSSDPNDVSNRRYFGARMAAARAGRAESQRTGRNGERPGGSRKETRR